MKALVRKTLITGTLVIGAITSAANVFAGHEEDGSFYAYGKVVEVEPIIRQVVETRPREECRQVRQQRLVHRNHHSGTTLRSLVGGLFGGVIGRQFGGGRGRTAFTIAGVFAGASIAKGSTHHRRHGRQLRRNEFRQHCATLDQIHRVEIVDGYRVTYHYQGREFTRTTRTRPGTEIRLRVQIDPLSESLLSGPTVLIEGHHISASEPHESS